MHAGVRDIDRAAIELEARSEFGRVDRDLLRCCGQHISKFLRRAQRAFEFRYRNRQCAGDFFNIIEMLRQLRKRDGPALQFVKCKLRRSFARAQCIGRLNAYARTDNLESQLSDCSFQVLRMQSIIDVV